VIISNKMKTRISYYISISPSYYVDLDIKIPARDSICNFIGYFGRCSVRDSAWNSQWIAERLVRDFVRDYFKQNEL
jgi:hypothetical protein